MYSDLELILARTQLAVTDLFEEPGNIFKRNLHEQAVTFRLGIHLQKHFPDFMVDCEYNRDVLDAKKLKTGKRFRPDVVVHRRGMVGPDNDRLIVEARKPRTWNRDFSGLCDRLCELTVLDGRFGYKLGLCWKIEPVRNSGAQEAHWFYNGHRIAQTTLSDFGKIVLQNLPKQ